VLMLMLMFLLMMLLLLLMVVMPMLLLMVMFVRLLKVSFDTSIEVIVTASLTGKQINRIKLPCPVFRDGMFLRAKIVGFDVEEQVYTLEYKVSCS